MCPDSYRDANPGKPGQVVRMPALMPRSVHSRGIEFPLL
jgi:hypothetical protein